MVGITGASGFIGSHLLKALDPSFPCRIQRGMIRNASHKPSAIVHLAWGIASRGSAEEIRTVNVDGTRALAKEADRNGVKRFVFLSSIHAVAWRDIKAKKPRTNIPANPHSAYGISKFEAEEVLRRLSIESRMQVVIIRAPLVYGPGVKANFQNLLRLVEMGIPQPLSALESNRRSFVGISNLIDLILLCLDHPAAANQTFHVSDDNDISTAELFRRIGKALGKPARNLPIPEAVLKLGLKLAGKEEWVDEILGDLTVDISETKRLLGWKPKVTMEEELERTAKWWRKRQERG